MVPVVGSTDPLLGTFKGVVRRPLNNDYCLHYEQNMFGVVVPIDVACNTSQCVVEGTCPQPATPVQAVSPTTATPVDNTTIVIVIVLIVAVVGLILWRKK